jgi:hypothetical protein
MSSPDPVLEHETGHGPWWIVDASSWRHQACAIHEHGQIDVFKPLYDERTDMSKGFWFARKDMTEHSQEHDHLQTVAIYASSNRMEWAIWHQAGRNT